jgi:hypothetical protein
MIIVTNPTGKPITCAAVVFEPGESKHPDKKLSPAKLAQIDNHPTLKRVNKDDAPAKKSPAKETN